MKPPNAVTRNVYGLRGCYNILFVKKVFIKRVQIIGTFTLGFIGKKCYCRQSEYGRVVKAPASGAKGSGFESDHEP